MPITPPNPEANLRAARVLREHARELRKLAKDREHLRQIADECDGTALRAAAAELLDVARYLEAAARDERKAFR